MSDEDLRDIGLPPNVVGQLRNIVKNQTSNGLNQIPSPSDKKAESTNSGVNSATESVDSEVNNKFQVTFQSKWIKENC